MRVFIYRCTCILTTAAAIAGAASNFVVCAAVPVCVFQNTYVLTEPIRELLLQICSPGFFFLRGCKFQKHTYTKPIDVACR